LECRTLRRCAARFRKERSTDMRKPFTPQMSSAVMAGGLACCVYLVFFGGHYVMGDHAYRMAWARSILDHGSHDISAQIPGTRHCVYGIGHSILHIPFLLLARGVQALTGMSCEGPINMLLYVFNATLGVMLVNLILQSLGAGPRSALWRSLAVGFASIWFPYSKVEYGESLVTTLL